MNEPKAESPENRPISKEEALALLPDAPRIHTFLGSIGADWDRAAVLLAIDASPEHWFIALGPYARMGHGLGIYTENGKRLAIETRR